MWKKNKTKKIVKTLHYWHLTQDISALGFSFLAYIQPFYVISLMDRIIMPQTSEIKDGLVSLSRDVISCVSMDIAQGDLTVVMENESVIHT